MSVQTRPAEHEGRLRVIRLLIYLAVLCVAVATVAGLWLLIATPEEGSSTESALGFTAAVSGLGVALFASAAAIYAQVNNLWQYAAKWFRVAVMIIVVVGLVFAIYTWLR